MHYSKRMLLLVIVAVLIVACGPQETPIPPTLIPSQTPLPPPTTVPTETLTPTPSQTPIPIPNLTAVDPVDQAFIRVIHGAPEVGTVDIYVEGLAFATSLNYKNLTQPGGLEAGSYIVRVLPGGTSLNTATPLVEQPVTITGQRTIIFLITGTPDALTLGVMDESTEPLGSSESRINVIHSVPRGPDFTVARDDVNITAPLTFGQMSPDLVLQSGDTQLTFQSGASTLLEYPITLRERRNYTLVLVGNANDLSTLEVLEFNTIATGLSEVQAINVSNMGRVDIYLDDIKISDGLDYTESTVPQTVPAKSYNLNIYEAAANTQDTLPLATMQFFANPDENIWVILLGEQDNLRVVTHRSSGEQTAGDQARITFLNTLPTVPRVHLETDGDYGLDLIYGQISAPQNFPAGPVNFYWSRVENGENQDILEIAQQMQLEAGNEYLYLFSGRMSGMPLLYSQSVGIDFTIGASEFQDEDEQPDIPPRGHFVNAMPYQPFVDFYIDDILIASEMDYQISTELLFLNEGESVLTVRSQEEDDVLLARATQTITYNTNFSIYAHGTETLGYGLTVIDDSDIDLDENFTSVRLLNFGADNSPSLNLGYAAPGGQIVQPDVSTNYRLTLPFGVTTFIRDVDVTISPVTLIPAGQYNLYVIDASTVETALIIPNVTLDSNRHYDVVVYAIDNTAKLDGFISPYPEG